MSVTFTVIIPARYASTRLPGKPLLDIAGKPMIQHVYEKACASDATNVYIATDDKRIQQVAESFGADVLMTSSNHTSGTDRLAEAALQLNLADDMPVVNLQGDEPLMRPALIRQVAEALIEHPEAPVSTLCEPVEEPEFSDPSVIKVIHDSKGFALYFSRAALPYLRDKENGYQSQPMRHVGLYAYRAAYLQTYTQLPAATIEEDEALEQLRILYSGDKIYSAVACECPEAGSVDTPADLEQVRRILEVS